MTRDDLCKGIRASFSLIDERTLFWKYIGQLEKRIAELEEPILCHKCNDHIDGDGAICGVCASTQDSIIKELRARSVLEWKRPAEELPQDGYYNLVIVNRGYLGEIYDFVYRRFGRWHTNGCGSYSDDEIIAWAELPVIQKEIEQRLKAREEK